MKRQLSIDVDGGYKNIKYIIKLGRLKTGGQRRLPHNTQKCETWAVCLWLVEIAAELNVARLLAYPRVTDILLFFIPLSLGTGSLIRLFSLIPTLICCLVAHHFINHISFAFANESVLCEYNKNGNKNIWIFW